MADCQAKVHIYNTTQIGQTIYQEGGMDAVLRRLEDDNAEAMGKGRPNGTTKLM
jgi:hypothetical protein